MLDDLVPNQFKVSNTLMLTGWNASMPIQEVLNQMEQVSYGKPSSRALFATNTLFKSPFAATEAPELLFHHIKQCQEVMALGKLPYTTEQVIQNALCHLMASIIFPMREFDTCENSMVKTYPALKTFIHEAYSRHLNSIELCNMSSSLGYTAPANTMYHMLENDDNKNDSTMDIMVATIAAAATTRSMLGNGMASSSIHLGLLAGINQSIAPAFN
jgi:hypothetical protein